MIAELGVLKWLKVNGVDRSNVKIQYVPFPLMIGPLIQGTFDAAFMPEPYRTQALEKGAKRIANPFQAVYESLCADVLDRAGKCRAEPRRAVPERDPVGRHLGEPEEERRNQRQDPREVHRNQRESDREVARTTFATRLRVSLAQPWLDVFAEYGVIPASFKPIDLVK